MSWAKEHTQRMGWPTVSLDRSGRGSTKSFLSSWEQTSDLDERAAQQTYLVTDHRCVRAIDIDIAGDDGCGHAVVIAVDDSCNRANDLEKPISTLWDCSFTFVFITALAFSLAIDLPAVTWDCNGTM